MLIRCDFMPNLRPQVLNEVFDRLKAAIDVVNAIEGYGNFDIGSVSHVFFSYMSPHVRRDIYST